MTSNSETVPLWIGGKQVTTGNTFNVHSPTSDKDLWQSAGASVNDAAKAVESAKAAFPSWRKTKPADIRSILLKAGDLFESRNDELANYMKEETGALDAFTGFNLSTAAAVCRDVAGRAADINGVIPRTAQEGQGAFVFKEPYGVVFGIAPWNAPYILGLRAFIYAIAAGNTVVLKGSELCPRTFWALGSIFHDAGLPGGVLNVIYHRPEDAVDVTNAIIEHEAIRKVNFTGSTHVGSIIAAKAGKELKPVLMELGGKASAIVCDDADLEHAAMQVALGSFLHAGQICMATERVIVSRSIVNDFGKALSAAAEKVYASSSDPPVLVATAGVEKNRKLVSDAVSKGAKLVHGSQDAKESNPYSLRPTILAEVTKDMDVFYTESFGPTVSLLAVDSDDAAVALANDTEYGLSGAVFTKDLGRGLKIAKQIDSGAVHINSMSVHDEPGLPHGGVKKSGWGRFNASWGLEEFLKLKTVTYME